MQYGFIESGTTSYFFHKSALQGESWHAICNDFDNGNPVNFEFEATQTQKGPRAENVRIVEV